MASSSSRRTKAVGGDSIGQFVIDQEIGKGSFAQVYAGKHKVSFELCPYSTTPGSLPCDCPQRPYPCSCGDDGGTGAAGSDRLLTLCTPE